MVWLVGQKVIPKLRKIHMVGYDILQPISDKDIATLRDLYKSVGPAASCVYNYLASVIKWNTIHPNTRYFTIYTPHGALKDGTFIAANEIGRNEIFLNTLEAGSRTLYEALAESKRMDWEKSWVFQALSGKLYPVVVEALEKTQFQPSLTKQSDLWRIPKETALNFELDCPDDVFVAPLQPAHARIVNSAWYARNIDSEDYWAMLIRINGGYGVFLKSNGELVSWVVRNLFGRAALQTVEEYKRRGYASLITKYLSKVIAEDGYEPLSVVHKTNRVQQNLLTNLGFEIIGEAFHIYNKEYTATLGQEKMQVAATN